MEKTIGARLLELKHRSGMPLAEIARLAGFKGPSSLQRYFSADFDPLHLDYTLALKLCQAMAETGIPPVQPYEIIGMTAPGADALKNSNQKVGQVNDTHAIIPVYWTVASSYKVESLSNFYNVPDLKAPSITISLRDPVRTLFATRSLEKRDVWAFINSGDRMTPRYDDGEIVFTEGRRRPVMGGYALAVVAKVGYIMEPGGGSDGLMAIFGRLKTMNETFVVLEYLNQGSGAEDVHLHMADVFALRRVMHPEDLLD